MELCDYPSERAILGGIFQHGLDAYLDVQDILQPETFLDETNTIIFKSYIYLFEEKKVKYLDRASLHNAVNHLGFSYIFADKDIIDHFKTIVNTQINLENIRPWAVKIRKLHIGRELKSQVKNIDVSLNNISGDETIEHILGLVENPIFDFSRLLMGQTNETKHIADNIDSYIDYLCNNVVETVGISTGYPIYDKSIGGGLRRKSISMIGARSKQGKSIWGINSALHIAGRLQIPVLYLDTEMDYEQQLSRIIPNIVHRLNTGILVTIDEFETGQFSKYDYKKDIVLKAKEKLKQTQFFYQNISGISPENVLSIIRRWLYKYVGFDKNGKTNDCVVIYDYVKLTDEAEIKHNISEFQRIGFIMTSLHNFAVKNDIPILGFIQLNRDGVDKESVTAVSQSDRVIWLCSNFSLYKDKSPEEIAQDGLQNGNKKIVPLITRYGSGLQTGDYINYKFEGQYARIMELDTKNNIKLSTNTNDMVKLEPGESVDVAIQTTNENSG